MIRKIIDICGSIFFPSSCYMCKKEGESFCLSCLSKIRRVVDTPSPSITSIYSFKEPIVKKVIHAIKYFHRKDLISPFVTMIAEDINRRNLNMDSYIFLPIPMPLSRKYMRGYNHAEAIAYEISYKTNISLKTNILTRAEIKKRQVTTKSRSERLKNQQKAFKVEKDVLGMNIILIDDVTTTGATLLEARRMLLEHGAKNVRAYTIAH